VRLNRQSQRRDDRLIRQLVARVVGGPEGDGVDAVYLGRILLLVTIALVAVGVPALDTDSVWWVRVAQAVSGVFAALALSFVIPWQRLSSRATLAFPVVVFGVLVLLSVSAAPAFAPLSGLIALCFAYIGLTQPPRTALTMLPIAGFAFVLISGGWSAAVVIRLLIAGVIWSILGELLAHLMVKQATLSADLRAAAHVDVLTGVANRRDLALRLATAEPGDALVLCDLDHFKQLNDTHGHHVGDEVLADFGALLRASLRGRDYCARYGGEEFVLILPNTTADQALTTLARMHEHWAVLRPRTTFSAGIAGCTADRGHTETLAAADAALYAAKRAGRDCDRVEASVFTPRTARSQLA
jgi:diguanylate cyclase (GGDEF)-like protein